MVPVQPPLPTAEKPVVVVTPHVELRHAGVDSLYFTSALKETTIAGMGGAINPPDLDATPANPGAVWWITDSVAPSRHADGTTFIACHTSNRRPALYPCSGIQPQIVKGDTITYVTAEATWQYVVMDTHRDDYGAFTDDAAFWRSSPGQLSWVMCYTAASNDGQKGNFVVIARMVDESN